MSNQELFSLDGKAIIVTGAGSGLGESIAMALAEAGASVVCADIEEATAESAAARITDGGWQASSHRVDISDETSVMELMDEAARRYGRLDVVFANAGISAHWVRVDEMTLSQWNRGIGVNLTGAFLTAKHAARHMIPLGSGKLIFTASIWGQVASPEMPVPDYAAAKGGVVNLTRELAMELLPHGITVNALSPGFFSTNIGSDKKVAAELKEQVRDSVTRWMPNHRRAHPDEIRGAAVFLAAPASDLVNGHVLPVDAGYLAR